MPGLNDPDVIARPNFDVAAFANFISDNGLQQGFVKRNDQYSRWNTRMDLRLCQELHIFFEGSRARLYMKVYSVLNLLNTEWGHQYDARFFSPDVVMSSVNAQGQYVYESFTPRPISTQREPESLWQVRLGVQIEF